MTLVLLAALQEAHPCIFVQCAPEVTLIGDPAGIANNNFYASTNYHMIPQLTLSLRCVRRRGTLADMRMRMRMNVGFSEAIVVFFRHIGILCARSNLELEPFNCMESAVSHSDHLLNQEDHLCA